MLRVDVLRVDVLRVDVLLLHVDGHIGHRDALTPSLSDLSQQLRQIDFGLTQSWRTSNQHDVTDHVVRPKCLRRNRRQSAFLFRVCFLSKQILSTAGNICQWIVDLVARTVREFFKCLELGGFKLLIKPLGECCVAAEFVDQVEPVHVRRRRQIPRQLFDHPNDVAEQIINNSLCREILVTIQVRRLANG